MQDSFRHNPKDENVSVWFKVVHFSIGVLLLIALVVLAASGWSKLFSGNA